LINFSHHINLFLGQITELPSYSCNVNDFHAEFSLSSSSHSAWEPITNCLLSKCNLNLTNNDNCRSSLISCFNYRTVTNVSICAPAILCSILESCNHTTNQCASNTSVCVINSCCSSSSVCLPLSSISFCTSGNDN
jgi:hypothetical protein